VDLGARERPARTMDPRAPESVPRVEGPELSDTGVDDLLQHAAWLRRLAARLAHDDGEADDLVQRTWLAALRRHGPRARPEGARGWLSRVLRNEARQHRRTQGRRRDHEALAAAPEDAAAPSAHALAADAESRLTLQRELLEAVDALGEPARSAVLARYFEGRTVAEIAERAAVPPRTVETRLRRARNSLRERLDGRLGSRGAWVLAALPKGLAHDGAAAAAARAVPDPSASAPAASAATTSFLLVAMNLKIAALGAVVAAAGALVLWQLGDDPGPAARSDLDGRARDASVEPVASAAPEAPDENVAREEAAIAAPEPAEDAAAATAPVPSVTGMVFDETGQPLPHFEVVFDPPLGGVSGATSDRDGLVEIPDVAGASTMRPRDGTLAILLSRRVLGYLRESGFGPILAVAPAYELRGRVVDPGGAPIEGAAWTLELPESHRARYADTLVSTDLATWSGGSAADGNVLLDGIPALAGCRLTVSAPGFVSLERSDLLLPDQAGALEPLALVLERLDPELVVRGVVRDPNGEPVKDAHVALALEAATTGPDGTFSFTLERNSRRRRGLQRLLAAAPGWRPVTYRPVPPSTAQPPESSGEDRSSWPDWVELRFEEPALEISGVVLGRDGEPQPGALVWIDDPTAIAGTDDMVLIESLGKPGYDFWKTYKTDADGRFVVSQLADRDYDLRALDPETFQVTEATVISAGASDAVLSLAPEIEIPVVEVEVVDARGEALPGATVFVERLVLYASVEGSNGGRLHRAPRNRDVAEEGSGVADENGIVDLGRVAQQPGVELHVHGDGLNTRRVPLVELPCEEIGHVRRVRVAVFQRCEARVVDAAPEADRATHFFLLDQGGERLQLTFSMENGWSQRRIGGLVDGESRVFWVSGEAATLELYRKSDLLESRPISLDPDALNVLQRR